MAAAIEVDLTRQRRGAGVRATHRAAAQLSKRSQIERAFRDCGRVPSRAHAAPRGARGLTPIEHQIERMRARRGSTAGRGGESGCPPFRPVRTEQATRARLTVNIRFHETWRPWRSPPCLLPLQAQAAPTAAQQCESAITRSPVQFAQCRLTAESKAQRALTGQKALTDALTKCSTKLDTSRRRPSTAWPAP